ncbi:MAG: DUF308 domain-containing protein [Acidobacteriaceae bacterium]|jgi:uncharacterized membrane protein HdeD (DUF308 family)
MSTSSVGSVGSIANGAVGWSIALSVVLILAGLFAIAVPPLVGVGVLLVVAWLILLSGAVHLVFAWSTRTTGGMIWELLLGFLYLAIGVDVLVHPAAGLAALTLILALYLFVEGVLELIFGFRLRPRAGAAWVMLDGVVTLFLAILIWRSWPSSSEWVIGTLVGISMLFSGTSRLFLSLAARRGLAAV